MKYSNVILSEIEPATFRFVAQCLDQLRHPRTSDVPFNQGKLREKWLSSSLLNFIFSEGDQLGYQLEDRQASTRL